mmetsp:Transcript_27384/g.45657  ORF Transcript_27384/g.45657 Transcript_27384/m.45657 type:complete len:170 (-) Transcript_27384:134-643(-)|eukprot:CAMPEP_0119311812 /NCGR_PEP_ID=MMETSP1333-20130426/23936_1 /TAXON_ID=418940 /ORGANISM="Scyphosphaera apsteinii, Strain RCC1455" /LENGTH=169 /DNA_ID=CAMNT_0007316287 /DNA_START=27 /DNA_END=536 /DNA_ORIENTATION=-
MSCCLKDDDTGYIWAVGPVSDIDNTTCEKSGQPLQFMYCPRCDYEKVFALMENDDFPLDTEDANLFYDKKSATACTTKHLVEWAPTLTVKHSKRGPFKDEPEVVFDLFKEDPYPDTDYDPPKPLNMKRFVLQHGIGRLLTPRCRAKLPGCVVEEINFYYGTGETKYAQG